MKNLSWKTAVELFGVTAIAGSLIFVGLQMRQAQQIAITENGWAGQNAALELRIAINDQANIWVKGNSGAVLDATETVIYRNLIGATNSRSAESWRARDRLGAQKSPAVHDLASFLFENPGARTAWNEYREELRRYRQPFRGDRYVNSFEALVRADLEILDNLAIEND